MARSVYRVSSARDAHVLCGASLIDAMREPPQTRDAYIYDARGRLALAAKHERRWVPTDRGAARLTAEADGWLEIFLRGARAFRRVANR